MRTAVSLLLLICLVLLGIGLATVATTSMWQGPGLAIKQLIWASVAIAACIASSMIPLELLRKSAWFIFAAACILLGLVLVPGVGLEIAGSKRWLSLGPVNYQPSEFAKLAVIVLVASLMSTVHRRADSFLHGFFVPIICVLVVAVLIVVEPDYGTTVLLVGISGAILFLSGSRLAYLSGAALLGIAVLAALVFIRPNSMNRIDAWLNQGNSDNPAAFQLEQSLLAFYFGGKTGVGLGESQQKELHLPEAHTDFIHAIWSEEQGLVGSLFLLSLFLGFFACGLFISEGCKHNTFGRLLGLGITFLITFQALINMGVVTGLLPTKGIALPFMSYGGSHLLSTGVMVGILVSIARHNERTITSDGPEASEMWS